MGTCDRVSGECACVDGFEGSACDRMSCPGTTSATEAETSGSDGTYDASETACTGHGQCLTMSMLAEAADENGVATEYTYGATPNDAFTWDHDMVQVGPMLVPLCSGVDYGGGGRRFGFALLHYDGCRSSEITTDSFDH